MKKDEFFRSRVDKIEKFVKYAGKSPFVRCLVLNGSFAAGSFSEKSDIDILTIAKSGRIFTARFFLSLKTFVHRDKRLNNDQKDHPGKFCLNYFLTDKFLTIPHDREEAMNRYCAENYSQSLLLGGDRTLFDDFMNENRGWFAKYIEAHGLADNDYREEFMRILPLSVKKGMFLERILGGWFGDLVEKALKYIQIAKIEKDPKIKKYPDLIVYNDRELRFHPPKNN